MRMRLTLAALALLACGTAAADDGPGRWTYGWDAGAGQAVATLREGERVAATIACRPPDGALVISDYVLGRRRASEASVEIGQSSVSWPARQERGAEGRALVVSFPQSPPILAAAVDPNARVVIRAGRNSHEWARGGGEKLREVARACWAADF